MGDILVGRPEGDRMVVRHGRVERNAEIIFEENRVKVKDVELPCPFNEPCPLKPIKH